MEGRKTSFNKSRSLQVTDVGILRSHRQSFCYLIVSELRNITHTHTQYMNFLKDLLQLP